MLKKLFRPKWQHENPEIRKAAISKLAPSDITILREVALHDQDAAVRQQAISNIEDLPLLEYLISHAQTVNDKEFSLKCWVAVLTQGEQIHPVSAENLILDCKNERLLGGIIAYSDNSSLKDLAFSGITDESQLLLLMKGTKNIHIWQATIEKLSSENAIKEAYAIVNGRDKKSQNAIKEKLDAIKSTRTLSLNQEKKVTHIIEKLEHLLKAEFDPLYEGILLTSKQQWHALENCLSIEKNQAIKTLLSQCENRLETNKQQKENIKQEAVKILEVEAEPVLLTEDLRRLKYSSLDINIETSPIIEAKSAIVDKWSNIKPQTNTRHQRIFNNLLSDLTNIIEAKALISQNNTAINLTHENLSKLTTNDISRCIENLKRISALLEKSNIDPSMDFPLHVKNLFDAAIQLQNNTEQKNRTLHKNIQSGIKDMDILIEKKELNHAQKKYAEIRKIIIQLPENESKIYSNTLQRIFLSIKTLDDWKNYANDKKRMELCEQMKNLIGTNSDPLTVSAIIKELQQAWKNLGHCPNQLLWEQFKSYADEAYMPCNEYFNQQKKIRAFNAEQRETICQQLETFLSSHDWNSTDWKVIDKLYKSIQDEWNKYTPVDRHQHQALQDRFFTSSNFLKEKINDERTKNTEILTTLINRAEKLIDAIDIQSSIDTYNKLQSEWKSVGITFHKKQTTQWQAFKKAGDALYEKRQNLRQDADDERQKNLADAISICREIANISQLDDRELENSKANVEKLKSDFHALGALPRESLRNCQQQFHSACEKFELNYKTIHQREWSRQLEKLAAAADYFLTIEINRDSFLNMPDGINLPEKWLKQLQTRFHPQTPASNNEYARTLCLELELIAGIETPAEDAQLKMHWQMSKLANNFGRLQLQSEHEKIEDLYLRWFSQKCWDENNYKHLQQRFLNAGKIVLNR